MWNRLYRVTSIQWFSSIALTGLKLNASRAMAVTYIIWWTFFFLSWLFCVFQFMFRMEVHIPLAWRGWFGGLGHWCSWMGLLWFRLVHLPLLLYFLDLTYSMLFNNLPFLMPALTRKSSPMLRGIQALPPLSGIVK